MLKKILGLLLIGLTTIGISQAYDYYSIYPGLEMEFRGLTYTCDTNANCTTTDQNDNTFNGLFFTVNNYGSNGRASAFFYDENNEGYLSQFRGYIGGTYTYSQRSPIQGCFGTYEKAMGDFTNDKVCDYNYNGRDGTGNANTGNTLSWLSDTTLAGKLNSIRFSPFGDQITICYNYGTGTQSFCFLSQDNQGSNVNYGIDFNTAYGQVFTSKLSLLPTGNSPRAGGGEEEITGSNVVCPSVQFKIAMYGYKYNTGMCYTDPLEFTGGQIVQVQQQSIFEIFSGYQDYVNRKYIYENNCHAPYTDEHCINAMQTNRKAKQIFSKIENAGLDSEKVYQYCHLQLEIEDKTQGICNIPDEELYATGVNQQGSQPNPFESLTDFIEENINLGVEAPREGSVFDEFLEDGETWITAITINRFGEFRKLYQKVMGLFAYRETQVGIIPGYITGIIMMILLLALFKK